MPVFISAGQLQFLTDVRAFADRIADGTSAAIGTMRSARWLRRIDRKRGRRVNGSGGRY